MVARSDAATVITDRAHKQLPHWFCAATFNAQSQFKGARTKSRNCGGSRFLACL
jgi:hypothetical protein